MTAFETAFETIGLDLPGGPFHALAAGTGRPVLYLHGFPDHPPTARAFLGELARERRGDRAVAARLRAVAARGPYDLATLVDDAAAMIERIGGPADVVGHDWGAVIVYALCATRPALVRRAVTAAVPHPLTMLKLLGTPAQLARSWYMGLFQLPGAGWIAGARDLALVERSETGGGDPDGSAGGAGGEASRPPTRAIHRTSPCSCVRLPLVRNRISFRVEARSR